MEKLDGYRAYWDGEKFHGRGKDGKLGTIYRCPDWFTIGLPDTPLDGELWAGRGGFEKVQSAVKGGRERDWDHLIYGIFDAPTLPGPYEKRIKSAAEITQSAALSFIVRKERCLGRQHLLKELDRVVDEGGEGMVLRMPGSPYVGGRSNYCLKVKKTMTAEAVVLEHIEGTRPGLTGSLMVMNTDGLMFDIGGLKEIEAREPPPIGSVVEYTYKALTKEGKPKPGSFLRVRKDVT